MSQRRLAADRDAPDVRRSATPRHTNPVATASSGSASGERLRHPRRRRSDVGGLRLGRRTERNGLVEALDGLGFTPGDVRRIVVTHAHWDHYSRAIGWQRRYGTTVMIGRQERHSIEAFDERTGAYPMLAQLLLKAGAVDLAQTIADFPLEPFERDVPFGPPDVWLDDGDHIDCGGVDLVARATPGHTRGHFVYEDRRAGSRSPVTTFFRGSHRRSGWSERPEALPLQSYLASLQLFLDLSDASMLPAHGADYPKR